MERVLERFTGKNGPGSRVLSVADIAIGTLIGRYGFTRKEAARSIKAACTKLEGKRK